MNSARGRVGWRVLGEARLTQLQARTRNTLASILMKYYLIWRHLAVHHNDVVIIALTLREEGTLQRSLAPFPEVFAISNTVKGNVLPIKTLEKHWLEHDSCSI